jgi:transcriptional regulator with XRE-family HTH domain
MKMSKSELSKRVKELRTRKGLSQEQLAEISGLSLRTIQRIENGETEPRGETLKRLMNSLEVAPDDLMDWSIVEDKGFLTAMNLSSLGFLFFPLLGILIPLVLWISKKDKVKNVNKTGKAILNFQITWVISLFLLYLIIFAGMILKLEHIKDVLPILNNPISFIIIILIMYAFNFLMIIANSILIYKNKEVKYFPKFLFIR